MGMWAQWRERRVEDLRNRIHAAAAADDAEDAQAGRLRILAVAQLSDIPPGAVFYLRPGEWRDDNDPHGLTYRDVRVDRIHDRVVVVDGVTWVGVTGHRLECQWLDEEHPPCRVMVVRVDAIVRAARS